jgi:hypothetical protein
MKCLGTMLALIFAIACDASGARAASVTIGATKDNSIFQNFADNSGGGSAGIFVGATGAGSPRRGLIGFDIAGNVPAGSTITSAQLTLYLALAGGGSNQAVELHRLSADWGEGMSGSDSPTVHFAGMGFAAGPGDATWNQRFFGSTSWTNPGATGDFAATQSASATIGGPGADPANPTPYTWGSTSALVSDVQAWLDNPAANFGWILVNSNEASAGSVRAFFSRSATVDAGGDHLEIAAQPALTITYTSIPEPAAGGLVLLAVVAGCFGRRR